MTLHERVRWLCNEHYGSVNAAALSIGVPQQTLQRLVAGKTPHLRLSTLIAIVSGFGCSRDWLVDGVGDPPAKVDTVELSPAVRLALIEART